jgi:hypothetical protein
MELFRPAAASTYISFPLADATGFALSGRAVTGTWAAWGDSAGLSAAGNPGFRNLSGAFAEIASTAVYGGYLASTELPAASPYVMLRFTATNTATQYLLIRTASIYANVTGIQGTAIATPITAGYMPMDVKNTISLTSPADNSIEKALARTYYATQYLDAAVSTRSAPASAQTIDQTTVISGATDNSIGKLYARLYHATQYLDAAISSRGTYSGGAIVGNITGDLSGSVGSVTGSVGSVTGNVGGNVLGSTASVTTVSDKTGYRLSATGVSDLLASALTEGYAADGAPFSLSQALYMIFSLLAEKSITSTTLTAKKLDGSTTAMTFTLSDATSPTSITRVS